METDAGEGEVVATPPSASIGASGASLDMACEPGWRRGVCVAFRFVCVYFVLYNLPFPLSHIPGLYSLASAYRKAWQRIIPWVGNSILHLGQPITVFPNGSGDTTFNYVQVFCFVVLAAAFTVVWTAVDFRRRHYPHLYDWLRTYIRWSLAFTMLSYGLSKVFKLQFPAPTPDRLTQAYGDSSPMGLLWTFMGASTAYTVFAGALEVLGGALLLWRRTTTLGALVLIGVMTNVVAMNFCYDVPVKLYSLHLLAMAAFLALPDAMRVLNVLLMRAAQARPIRPLATSPSARRTLLVIKTLAIAWVLCFQVAGALQQQEKQGGGAPKPELYGLYRVEEFSREGSPVPPSDAQRWRKVSIERGELVSVRTMDDTRLVFQGKTNPSANSLTLTWLRRQGAAPLAFEYARSDSALTFEGEMDGHVIVKMKPIPVSDFLLTSRGFHWINEYPFNR